MVQVPVAQPLFTWPSEEPQLIGTRCGACEITASVRRLYGAPGTAGVSILSV